ncbi:hypothetical protein, partial [Staphylococcus warneri]|uniref:hypothetical protein n=1 Tax=Staphylococcus warneri TaxID=1292 RepID=UPI001C92E115
LIVTKSDEIREVEDTLVGECNIELDMGGLSEMWWKVMGKDEDEEVDLYGGGSKDIFGEV